MRFAKGEVLFEKYRIEHLLGRGGFAEVYSATHLALNAPRALKVLVKGGDITSGVLSKGAQRFQLEAQLGARFARESHIVRVYDFEQDREKGLLVLVMEYLPGGSLKDHIRTARQQGLAGLPVDFVVRTAYDIAQALAALHRAELVHRDIKPSNILYDEDGTAKLADLGIVQLAHGVTQRTELGDQAPRHPGTPEYMSPEQAKTLDYLPPASDTYSLGVVLFEALTLKRYKHLHPGTRVRDLRPEVPEWLDDLVAQMLVKEAEQRPWDGENLSRLLAPYVKGGAAWDEDMTMAPERRLSEPPPSPAPAAQESAKKEPHPKVPAASDKVHSSVEPRWPLWRLAFGGVVALVLLVFGVALLGKLGGRATLQPTASPVPMFTSAIAASPTQISTPRATAIWAPNPTATWTPTSTPTPFAGPLLLGTPLPMENLVPITVANADRVRELARWNSANVDSVVFSPDGWLLASTGQSEKIRLWRVIDGTLVRALTGYLTVAFSPDGKLLASGLYPTWIQIRRVSDGALVRKFDAYLSRLGNITFSPTGMLLASGGGDGAVRLWRVSDGSLIRTLDGHEAQVTDVVFSPEGSLLASGSADGTVRLWQVADGALVRILESPGGRVGSVAFSPEGTLLASGSCGEESGVFYFKECTEGEVRLWRVTDGALVRTLKGPRGWVWSVAFSPDGEILASGSCEKWKGDKVCIKGEIRLWRVSNGALLRILEGHTHWVSSVTFSPDGTLLASGSWDGTVRLWGVVEP